MIPLSLDSLYDYLTSQSIDVKRQTETDQLYILFKVQDQEFPVFLRSIDDGELIQLLAFIPISLEAKTIPEVARLLHLFNKEIDIPGFGMDEKAKVVFYRVVLPSIEGQVSGEIIEGYINSIKVLTETFFPVIAAVVAGKATFAEVVKKANEMGVG